MMALTAFVGSPMEVVSRIEGAVILLVPGIPGIVLFWLLSGDGVTVWISKRQQYAVFLLVVIRTVGVLLSCLRWWRTGITRNVGHLVATSGNLVFWFVQSFARFLISDVLSLVEGVAFIAFLVLLSRQVLGGDGTERHWRQPRLVTGIALAVGIIVVLEVIAGGILPYFWLRSLKLEPESKTLLAQLRIVVLSLPGVITPWIIYFSSQGGTEVTEAE